MTLISCPVVCTASVIPPPGVCTNWEFNGTATPLRKVLYKAKMVDRRSFGGNMSYRTLSKQTKPSLPPTNFESVSCCVLERVALNGGSFYGLRGSPC